MSGVVGFVLGAVVGGTLGTLAMALLVSCDERIEEARLYAALRASEIRAESEARRCSRLSAEAASLAGVARDLLAQVEEDDRELGTSHGARYRGRLGVMGILGKEGEER